MYRLFSWPCLDLVSFAGNSGYTDRELSQDEKRRKNVMELPAKNRRVKTPSFTLVDQWQDPGPSGGFRQTNYYKSSPLRKHTKKLLALTVGHG